MMVSVMQSSFKKREEGEKRLYSLRKPGGIRSYAANDEVPRVKNKQTNAGNNGKRNAPSMTAKKMYQV